MRHSGEKKLLTAIIILLLAFFFMDTAGAAPKWKFVGFTRYRDPLFVDLARTTADKTGTVNVWMRITVADKSLLRRQLKKDLQMVRKSPRDVKFLEMNKDIVCRGSWIRHVGVVYYDRNGRLLARTWDAMAPWKPIEAGSLWPELQKAVCARAGAR